MHMTSNGVHPQTDIEKNTSNAQTIVLEMENSECSDSPVTEWPQRSEPVAAPSSTKPPRPEIVPGFPVEGPYLMGPKAMGDHWEQCHKAVEKHDNDMCKSWREEIDTLLVFAGLFTAIVTAFTVESYQWLAPDPTDLTNQLLSELISLQRGNPLPPASNPSVEFSVPSYAVRVNSFWFSSITISLAAGVIGILCKQWMREYQRDAALPAKDALALRQLRYIGWKRWGVPHIISLPAILLQASLLLFLGGLIDFLWNKFECHTVAICATMLVTLTAVLMGSTTILPLGYLLWQKRAKSKRRVLPQCPFKSPQSYLLLKFWDFVGRPVLQYFSSHDYGHRFSTWLNMERETLAQNVRMCGTKFDHSAGLRYRSKALHWIRSTLAFNSRVRDHLYHCFLESRLPCKRYYHHHHLSPPETVEQCHRDEFPASIIHSVYQEGPRPGLGAEVLLRNHLFAPGQQGENDLYRELFLSHANFPNVVVDQVFKYVEYCIKHKSVGSHAWHWVLGRGLEPKFDTKFQALMGACLELLSSDLGTQECTNTVESFINELELQDFGCFFLSIQPRPIFGPLMTCLKRSCYWLRRHEPESHALRAAAKTIKSIYAETSLRRDFFDDFDSDTLGPLPSRVDNPVRVGYQPIPVEGEDPVPSSEALTPPLRPKGSQTESLVELAQML